MFLYRALIVGRVAPTIAIDSFLALSNCWAVDNWRRGLLLLLCSASLSLMSKGCRCVRMGELLHLIFHSFKLYRNVFEINRKQRLLNIYIICSVNIIIFLWWFIQLIFRRCALFFKFLLGKLLWFLELIPNQNKIDNVYFALFLLTA